VSVVVSSRRVSSWWLTVMLAVVLAAGCAAPPADQEDTTEPATDRVVAFSRLSGLLPSPSGWTRTEPTGGQVGLPDLPRSSSATSYTRDGAKIELEIVDTGGRPEYVETTQIVAGTDFERVSDNGYVRGSSMADFPAIESWNHVDELGEITVLLVNRFVVHAAGSGLANIEELRAFVLEMDLESIATLEPR